MMARMRAGARKVASSIGSMSGASTSSKFSAWIRGKRGQDAGGSSDSKQQQKDTGDQAAHTAAQTAAAAGEATAVVTVVAAAGTTASLSAAVAEGRRSSSGGQDTTLLSPAWQWGSGFGVAGWLTAGGNQAAAGGSSSRALQRRTSSLRRRRLTNDTQGTSSSSNGQQQLEQAAVLASRSALPPQDLFPSLLANVPPSHEAGSLASTLFGTMPRSYVADGGGIMAAGLHEDFTWVEFLDTLAAIHGGPGSSSWRRRSSEAGSKVMPQGSRWV
jgi:hypothetical protein